MGGLCNGASMRASPIVPILSRNKNVIYIHISDMHILDALIIVITDYTL